MKYDGLADLPSLLDFYYSCSRLQWSWCGWIFNHRFFDCKLQEASFHHRQHCFLSAWHSAGVADRINGPDSSLLLYPHPLPCDFAVCPIKEAESIFLPLGFQFGYVTCFGQWNISRPKAWRETESWQSTWKWDLAPCTSAIAGRGTRLGSQCGPGRGWETRGMDMQHHSQTGLHQPIHNRVRQSLSEIICASTNTDLWECNDWCLKLLSLVWFWSMVVALALADSGV